MTSRIFGAWRPVALVVTLVIAGVAATGCTPQTIVLQGQLTASSTSTVVAGVPVMAYSSASETLVATTSTDEDGHYSFDSTRLPPGTYRLKFADDNWYPDATAWQTASDLTVSASNPVTADANLALSGGSLSGRVDDGANPLAGITVLAIDQDTDVIAGRVSTDAGGNFTLGSLYPQNYVLVFSDPNQRMRSEVWGATSTDIGSGIAFPVAAGTDSDDGVFNLVGRDCDPDQIQAGADLAGADLTDCDLSYRDLTGTDFTGAVLTNANFTASNLTGVHLGGAILDNTNLYYTQSSGIVGTPSSLPTSWMLVNGYLIGPGVNLPSAQLQSSNLQHAILTFAQLAGADLSDANAASAGFVSTNLTGADLSGASLVGTWITASNLTDADLSGADLTSAVLNGSTLSGTNISGANFANAVMQGLASSGLVGTPSSLPANWLLVDGYLIGPTARIPGAQLDHADLTGVDLQSVAANGASLRQANLTNADLSNANLSGTDLTDATLVGVNLSGTNLGGANLTGVISSGITGTPATLPTGWALVDGALVEVPAP